MSYAIRFIGTVLVHLKLAYRCESLTAGIRFNLRAFPLVAVLPLAAFSNKWTATLLKSLVALSSVDSLEDLVPESSGDYS